MYLLATFTGLLDAMIKRSGFRIEEAVYSTDGFLAVYVASAA